MNRATAVAAPEVDTAGNHPRGEMPLSQILDAAAEAYARDADHVARHLLIGALLEGKADQAQVFGAVERGLAAYRQRLDDFKASRALR